MTSTIYRNCGVLRDVKLKGGGKKLMNPKPCDGYVRLNLSFDGKHYAGKCNKCLFGKTIKAEVL